MRLHAEYVGDELETIEAVFPGGALPSHKEVVRQEMDLALARIQAVVQIRHHLAVSGAMRWEWSQEAPIISSSSIELRA